MQTQIKYSDITLYLDAIAGAAEGNIGGAPHHTWWRQDHNANEPPLTYDDFVNGTVYGVNVPIIDKTDPLQSMFYVLLTTKGGSGGYHQMPWRGPYITNANYEVQLATTPNPTTITGADIQANLKEWLSSGYPE